MTYLSEFSKDIDSDVFLQLLSGSVKNIRFGVVGMNQNLCI